MEYNNEQEVVKELGLKSLIDVPKRKFMNVVTMIPEMSDEVRIKVVEKVPQFTQFCGNSLNTVKDSLKSVLDSNERTTKTLIEKIDIIREDISKGMNSKKLSKKERKERVEHLKEVAEIYNEMDERNKKFLDKSLGKIIVALALVLGAAVVFAAGGQISINDDD